MVISSREKQIDIGKEDLIIGVYIHCYAFDLQIMLHVYRSDGRDQIFHFFYQIMTKL